MKRALVPSICGFLWISASQMAAQNLPGQSSSRALSPFGSKRELTAFLKSQFDASDWLQEAEIQRACEASIAPDSGPRSVGLPTAPVRIARASIARETVLIHGRVTDENGVRRAGVEVLVQRHPELSTTTSADGEYHLSIAPELAMDSSVAIAFHYNLYRERRLLRTLLEDSSRANVTLRCGIEFGFGERFEHYRSAVRPETSVQAEGVEPGDIVKRHGGYLIVLRRDRLFVIDIRGKRLIPQPGVHAFGPGFDPSGTSYDQLHVIGDLVVVTGESDERHATEAGVFRVDSVGRLAYLYTSQLRDSDSHDSFDFAEDTNVVGDQLIFYAQYDLWSLDLDGFSTLVPMLRTPHDGESDTEFTPTASIHSIYKPGRPIGPYVTPGIPDFLNYSSGVAIHSVTVCRVDPTALTCRSTSVLDAPGTRGSQYVTHSAVYLWLQDPSPGGDYTRTASMLYRVPLDGSAPTALGVRGVPTDRWSFLETDEGHLNILVHSDLEAGIPAGATSQNNRLELLRIPLSAFGDGGQQAPESWYHVLPTPPNSGILINRFIGHSLLYATSMTNSTAAVTLSNLYVVDWRDATVMIIPLAQTVDAIHPIARDALVAGRDGNVVRFSSIRLAPRPKLVDSRAVVPSGDAEEHVEVLRPTRGGEVGLSGVLAYRQTSGDDTGAYGEAGSIGLFWTRDLRLRDWGAFKVSAAAAYDDDCPTACEGPLDNTRLLMVDGRALILAGDEIIEVRRSGGSTRAIRRVNHASIQAATRSTPTE